MKLVTVVTEDVFNNFMYIIQLYEKIRLPSCAMVVENSRCIFTTSKISCSIFIRFESVIMHSY